MIEIIIFFILIFVLYNVINNKNYTNKNYTKDKFKNVNLNAVTRKNRCEDNKKIKTFISRPIQYDCLTDDKFETEEDKFIDEYVFKSNLFCKKTEPEPTKNELAEYRDSFFNFRNKTNISTNLISSTENINELLLGQGDLNGKNIGDVYDDLVSNKNNLVYNF
jgi:hypothetical protein